MQGRRYLHREEAALAAFFRDNSLRAGSLDEGYLLGQPRAGPPGNQVGQREAFLPGQAHRRLAGQYSAKQGPLLPVPPERPDGLDATQSQCRGVASRQQLVDYFLIISRIVHQRMD